MDEMMSSAERILKRAVEKGADSAEVFYLNRKTDSYSIEKNVINFTSGNVNRGFGIRVLSGHRIGFSYATTEEKAMKAVDEAIRLTSLSREMKGFSFPAGGGFKKAEKAWDDRILAIEPKDGAELSKVMIDAALEVDKSILAAEGGMDVGYYHTGIVNSEGLSVSDRGTFASAGLYAVFTEGNVSTGEEFVLSRQMDMDLAEIGRKAATMAVRHHNPVPLEKGGQIPVVFANTALNQMFEFITVPALYGDAAERGESVYSRKVGEQVTDSSISIVDDGLMPGGIMTQKMDDEGVPSQRNVIIERGELKEFLYDLSSASEFGKKPTGNGVRAQRLSATNTFKAPPISGARNISIEGDAKPLDKVISEIDYGVLVYSVLGAHTSNPASGDFSVNSAQLLLIEKGEITRPIRSAMLSGNMPSALRSVIGIADDYKVMSGHIYFMGSRLPSIAVNGVNVTG